MILADCKTGKAKLTREQKLIQKTCEQGRAKWMTIKLLEDL